MPPKLYALHEGRDRLVMIDKYEPEQARSEHRKGAALADLRPALEGKLSSDLDAQVPVPHPAGNAQKGAVTARQFRSVSWGSSGDELLSAVDVVSRAGERGVGHDVNGECGDVGGTDDAADGERRAQLVPALLESISEQRG